MKKTYSLLILLCFSLNANSAIALTDTKPLIEPDTNLYTLKHKMIGTTLQSAIRLKEYYKYGFVSNQKSIHNREFSQSLSFNNGYSCLNTRSNSVLKAYQDTSSNVFSINQSSPIISITHNISFSDIFSISYTLGYQRSLIRMNRTKFGANKFLAFINPRLTTSRNRRIETYFQLKVGLIYDDKNLKSIKSNTICYLIPTNFKIYTGFTPLGVSMKLNQQINLNLEWSLWSYETINIGLKYNFKKID